MDPGHRALLRKHRVYLSGELLVSDTIVPFLFQEEVLTAAQVEDVESQTTNRLKTLRLLDLLPTRGPRAFDCFLRSLEDFSWVRDRLLLELQSPPGPGSADSWQLPDSVLTRQLSDRELSRLAAQLGPRWEEVLMDLGLSSESVFRCRADHGLSSQGAALAGLIQWRRAKGRGATIHRLIQSLQAADLHPSILQDVLL
ncbi:hypothetical protein INR49_008862 [Caranx melampygus]|nr:hypothetical protein INR49_008862 [Caranx melampygus]